MNIDKQVTAYIQKAPAEQVAIIETLRQLVHDAVQGTTEAIKWGFPVFSNGSNFAYIKSNKNHVTFGFYNPEKIDDPNKLLEGTGNTMRHVKVKKTDDIDSALFTRWLKAISEQGK